MKLLMLVNPHAGTQRGRAAAKDSIRLFEQKGVKVDCRYSESPRQLIRIAE